MRRASSARIPRAHTYEKEETKRDILLVAEGRDILCGAKVQCGRVE
jgi:hypothetical protein